MPVKYKDELGHEYEVPDEFVEEFERRRTVVLTVAIVVKLLILGGMLLIWWLK